MSSASFVAATLRPETRQQIAIEALANAKPISHLATDYEVSRKFVYQQSDKAKQALDESFVPKTPDEQVLFHLPITKNGVAKFGDELSRDRHLSKLEIVNQQSN